MIKDNHLEKLILALGEDFDLTGEEIADVLWLAVQRHKYSDALTKDTPWWSKLSDLITQIRNLIQPKIPKAKKSKPVSSTVTQKKPTVDIYPQTPSSISTSSPSNILPIRVPDAPSLREPLHIAQALRPLMKKIASGRKIILDEIATAERSAEYQLYLPILKPETEPWLDLALVIDESQSMSIWGHTIADLKRLVQHYGIFRDVRIWGLVTDKKGEVKLLPRIKTQGQEQRHASPRELIDPNGRQLILVVSDCVSRLWYDGAMIPPLQAWSQRQPLAILQMLPDWLWLRTGLGNGASVLLKSLAPGVANQKLQIEELLLRKDFKLLEGIKLPVLSLNPDLATVWSEMVVGKSEAVTAGFVFPPRLESDEESLPETEVAQLDAQGRITRFRQTASPIARKLAGLLAAAPVINLPVVRIVQDTLLPQSNQVHVAEVFLGGLLRPLNVIEADTNPDMVQYDFMDDSIRQTFLKDAPVSDSAEVFDAASQYVAYRLNKSLQDFVALLKAPTTEQEEEGITAFAEVAIKVLKGLGGDYAKFAQELERTQTVVEAVRTVPIESLQAFNLQSFPVEVGTIIFEEEEELLKLEFETVFVNKRGQIIETQQCESFYYDEPLEVESSVGGQGLRPTPENQPSSFPPPSEGGARGGLNSGESPIPNLRMIAIPNGEFWMGSAEGEKDRYNDESPQHKVTVSSFFMSQTPITEAQWRFVANLPQEQRELNPNPANNGDDHPVVNVSWQDAMEFCARLSRYTGRNYRLPSEAEWEYACRSVISEESTLAEWNEKYNQPFHFGETITGELANYHASSTYAEEPKGEYREKTIPVGQFHPNAFGLYDMHGNVWEWCLDPWHDNYDGAPNDGRVWDEGKEELSEDILTNLNILLQDERDHVIRGGSWDYDPRYCRSAYRDLYDIPDGYFGFRVVCVPPRTP